MKTLFLLLLLASCGGQVIVTTPQPQPQPIPAPEHKPVEEDLVVTEPETDTPAFNYMEIAASVDKHLNNSQLTKKRGDTTFATEIYKAVEYGMEERVVPLDTLASTFNLVTKHKVSLNDELCEVTHSQLNTLLTPINGKAVTVTKANYDTAMRFAKEVNALDKVGKQKAYTRLMYCLAYSESLSTADTSGSIALARKIGGEKHSGVKFYGDDLQTNPNSWLNIGLFQFSPVASGNIHPCLNEFGITKRKYTDLVSLLGAQDQSFNAMCGVHKIRSLFYVSKNTSSSRRKAGESCVSLHNRNAYNHFGPLQRDGNPGGGFAKLYSCYFGSK
jgi:hypothetical protein